MIRTDCDFQTVCYVEIWVTCMEWRITEFVIDLKRFFLTHDFNDSSDLDFKMKITNFVKIRSELQWFVISLSTTALSWL